MRLTPQQADLIRQRIRATMGDRTRIWLFGSRADDQRRGGDVDLYVEPESLVSLEAEVRCKGALADALDLEVDLVVAQPNLDKPIYRIAKRSGLPL